MTKIVAILNITPDSFSDGGKYTSYENIISQSKDLIKDGADVLDIGAESTRPGAIQLTHEEEWDRLEESLSDIIKLAHESNVEVSVDTRHAQTAAKSLELGVDCINDVSGLNSEDMIEVIRDSDVKLIVMHSLTVPADKSVVLPDDVDVIEELKSWAEKKVSQLQQKGIDKARIIFDPGLGFGKNAKQSWEIINRVTEFANLGVPLYIGHSRKSFLGADTLEEKDAMTHEISKKLIGAGVGYIRLHNLKGF